MAVLREKRRCLRVAVNVSETVLICIKTIKYKHFAYCRFAVICNFFRISFQFVGRISLQMGRHLILMEIERVMHLKL